MCGLFGLLRSPAAEHREWASNAFVVLGVMAEERGRDSTGVALFTDHRSRPLRPGPVPEVSDVSLDGCRLIKGRGAFSAVWRSDLLSLLDFAPIVLGHTRRATQGSPNRLANAAPLVVDGLVGTHNGDVDAAPLRVQFGLPPAVGGTDSEVIYQAIAAIGDPVRVLTALTGRAALVWVDRGRPDQVHLARAAFSPLTVAVDTEQNIYWASNPGWFRAVERHTPVRFVSAVLLREGTYLTLSSRPRPHVTGRAGFQPTARLPDLLLADHVWTGFTAADRDKDCAQLCHQIADAADRVIPVR